MNKSQYTCRVHHQFLPILQLQKMNHPVYAGLYFHFSEIQFRCDIEVVQIFTQGAINRAQDAGLFPEAAYFMPPA